MKKIIINNFRCYSHQEIEFRSGINLLIGDNASGKTSLIRACNFVANSLFCGYSDENTVWKSVEDDDFRLNVDSNYTILPEQPVSVSFCLAPWNLYPIEDENTTVDIDYSTVFQLEKRSKKNARNLLTGLTPLKEYASHLRSSSHVENDAGIR